jgi:hypothetical protein
MANWWPFYSCWGVNTSASAVSSSCELMSSPTHVHILVGQLLLFQHTYCGTIKLRLKAALARAACNRSLSAARSGHVPLFAPYMSNHSTSIWPFTRCIHVPLERGTARWKAESKAVAVLPPNPQWSKRRV